MKTDSSFYQLTDRFEKSIFDGMEAFFRAREAWLRNFMFLKYGVISDEDIKKVIQKKHLSIAYDCDGMIGVIANNRWLYTVDGKTIGKKGKRFLL